MTMRLLFAEDEKAIADHVMISLTDVGFEVQHVDNGPDAWELGGEGNFDAIVLDLGLPGLDGMTLLKRWRREGVETPVIVVTARGSWMERVDGFEAGADDYLPKPFRTEELIARIRALIRRAGPKNIGRLSNGSLQFDENSMSAKLDGKPLELSPLEAKALQYLLVRCGKVVSPGELAENVQGRSDEVGNNAVEAMITRLRKKLGADIILTRRGFGYYIPEQQQ
jgi:two-component system, OmpR family, response regulator